MIIPAIILNIALIVKRGTTPNRLTMQLDYVKTRLAINLVTMPMVVRATVLIGLSALVTSL